MANDSAVTSNFTHVPGCAQWCSGRCVCAGVCVCVCTRVRMCVAGCGRMRTQEDSSSPLQEIVRKTRYKKSIYMEVLKNDNFLGPPGAWEKAPDERLQPGNKETFNFGMPLVS